MIPLRARLQRVGGALPPSSSVRGEPLRARRAIWLALDDGAHVGWGEAAPLPGYSPDGGEPLEAIERALAEATADLHLDERPPLAQARAAVARLPAALPSARFALECALLDLLARRAGLPLAALLGDPTASVPLNALVDGADAAAVTSQVRRAAAHGHRCFKLKIGGGAVAEEDEARLRALREAAGPDAVLRLDANGSLPIASAAARLAALSIDRPVLIEEPVAWGELPSLASPLPVALDESLHEQAELRIDAALPALASTVVLKPAALGGLVRCLELAARARARGGAVIVTHLLDGPIGLAAAAALALALRSAVAGLAPHPGLAAFPRCPLAFLDGATLHRTDAPGLGVAP